MSKTFDEKLNAYAELAVKVGVNIQPGQRVLVRAPIESSQLVNAIAKSAYQAGSPLVSVMYHDDQLSLTRFENAPSGSFSTYAEWEASALLECAKRGDAFIKISGTDPDLLKDQNQDNISMAIKSAQEHMAEFMQYPMSDKIPWVVISVPVPGWAGKVFPGLREEDAMAKLWDEIFRTCRVDRENPIDAWQAHLDNLESHSKKLNDYAFDALHYTGGGTDFTVGLPKGHIWKSGGSVAASGVTFVANLPTEEVFTLPHKDRAEGIVKASKPLNYGGTVISDFSVRFEAGKAVEIQAAQGQETLQKLIDTDAGASKLGEIALVPHRSPISDSGLLFFNTLFDENAASHIALGKAYRFTLKGGKEMTEEEFNEAGGNNSLTHVDFMIGHDALDIDGIQADGTRISVMKQGEWAM